MYPDMVVVVHYHLAVVEVALRVVAVEVHCRVQVVRHHNHPRTGSRMIGRSK